MTPHRTQQDRPRIPRRAGTSAASPGPQPSPEAKTSPAGRNTPLRRWSVAELMARHGSASEAGVAIAARNPRERDVEPAPERVVAEEPFRTERLPGPLGPGPVGVT